MTNFKHLSPFELSAYHNSSLEQAVRHEIGKHLLTCRECRKQLPLPSVEKFWSAIMTENEPDDSPVSERLKLSFSPAFSSFWNLRFNLVWGSGTLIVILGFSFLIWFAGSYQPNEEREVAQVFDVEKESLKQNEIVEHNLQPPAQNSETETRVSSSTSNRAARDSKPTLPKNNQQKVKQVLSENKLRPIPAKKVLNQKKENIALTRGGSVNCENEDLVEMEFVSNKEAVTFRWKKVPSALKYHLYVSDEEEILIDEFETERETSYTLKKSLDAAKTYKWKVVVTTEDGKTIVGDSQKFTIKGLQLNRNKSEKKVKQQIRCSEDKSLAR